MKKNNYNGFMLLETLIISTVILGTLIFLYAQFTSIKTNYDISFRYNTVPGLYAAREVANYFNEYGYTTLATNLDNGSKPYIDIFNNTSFFEVGSDTNLYKNLVGQINAIKIFFVNDDLDNLKSYISNDVKDDQSIFNQELKQYILRLETEKTNKYRIIIEFKDNTFASVMIS